MSGPEDIAQEVAQEAVKVAKGSTLPKLILTACAVLFVLLAGALLTTRYGVLLPQGRLLIEARASGLKIGRFGKLKIEGLGGDVWRDFTVRRLTVADEKGVWLEARNVAVSWRYAELLRRRMQADRITAERVILIRRPTLTPKEESRGLPVSFTLDAVKARVELQPAFSYRRGVYDVAMSLDVRRRNAGQKGVIAAASALHAGDHLFVSFDFGGGGPLKVLASAREAKGGALAGSIGLPADQPFVMRVQADGSNSQGRFTAMALSGETRPLDATGAWNPEGGSARGRLRLGASGLTEWLAERAGPEVAFTITGRRAPASLYDLDARLAAANLQVDLKGRANLGERRIGPAGLAVVATSPELSKVTGGPAMGPARLTGSLTGRMDDLRLAGALGVDRFALGGYTVARVTGPVEFTRRDRILGFKGRLAGAGGAGRGWIAALLGRAPTGEVEGARLRDGRWLFRDLDVAGSGLKLQASGDRGLLGSLSFKGEAQLTNLAAARPGAGGALQGDWSATQSGPHQPWTYAFEASGAKFTSGFAELDRLLGAAPRLEARGAIARDRFSVTEARLDGQALDATSAGVLEAGEMKFKLDWTAQGPFRAGPVEIAGQARGSGAVTGAPATPRLDLNADIDSIDVPRLPLKDAKLTLSFLRRADGSSGVVALTAASPHGPARGRAAFAFPVGGVDLTEVDIDAGGVKAEGSIALRRRSPSAADLKLAIGRGAILEAGTVVGTLNVVDAPDGPRARLDLTARGAVLPGRRIAIQGGRLTADGPLAELPYSAQLAGSSSDGRWNLGGRGVLRRQGGTYELGFNGLGRFGRRDIRTVETAVLRLAPDERTARLRLAASDGGRIDLDARLAGQEADIRAQVEKLGLGLLSEDLAGMADATLTLKGQGGRLEGVLDARLDDARGRGSDVAQGLDGVLKARLADEQILVDAELTNPQGLRASADLVLPAVATAAPLRIAVARTRPIRGRYFAEGEVKPLWDLLIGGERDLAGQVRLEGELGGTLNDPRATGHASVEKGRFSDGATGLVLTDATLRADFADNAVNVTEATGSDGHGGSVAGAGRISLLRDGVSTFRLDLKGFRLIDNEQATASATGKATLDRGADGKIRLAGALAIDRADVAANVSTPTGVIALDVIERNKPADLTVALQSAPRRGPAVALDVDLKAPRRVFVRGRGLDVELSLDAHVGGTTAKPALSGVARVVRGDYDFAAKRFAFDERGVVYLATTPEAIRLDLSATREDPALTAVVRIRGTAAKPEITLTSTPVLPNDEVLSQVLFGRSASQLSPLEAAQLASALSALAGGGGFDVIGNLRSFAGLDRLALGGGGESGVTVSGGKYLTDDVYLELTGGGREGSSAQVEWRVGRNLSIISKLAGQGGGRLAVRWRRDY